jgi:hypothetical protein
MPVHVHGRQWDGRLSNGLANENLERVSQGKRCLSFAEFAREQIRRGLDKGAEQEPMAAVG